ncbi:MAG: SH3 domain-containing protein [Alphaproteobacteria bacterium]
MRLFLYTAFVFFLISPVQAQERADAFSVTGYPIPRFVSLSSDKVYMRSGPGRKYPVLWEYQRKGLPVEVVMEFDVWRKIRDYEGTQGWVHRSLLSGKRTAIINHEDLVPIKRKPKESARLMAYIQPLALLSLEECDNEWCFIEAQGYSGWVQRKFLWGVYEGETID